MSKQTDSTTQRAYTLRLRGTDPNDSSWRTALWKTHEAVNKGAKVFGDWLLTLRGGLDHTLADAKVKAGKEGTDRDPTPEERKERRILLALSWLSVESELGAPQKFIIARGNEAAKTRNDKVIAALKEILKKRGLADEDIGEWIKDCSASLSAAIREDAVWVNRSEAFDEACGNENKKEARKDAQTLLWYLLTDDYLKFPKKQDNKSETTNSNDDEGNIGDDNPGGLAVKSGKGAGQKTRHPFSHIFGRDREKSKGFGQPKRNLNLRNYWFKYLKPKIESAGIPMVYPDAMDKKNGLASPTELHREMFSKAAERLAQIWTKLKQQELEREQLTANIDELRRIEKNNNYKAAFDILDALCLKRALDTGSSEEYYINPRAIGGWNHVVDAWKKISETDKDKATEERTKEVKRLQKEDNDNKFGDINIFLELAKQDYEPVWLQNGQADPSILTTYVKAWKAQIDAKRLKIAAFRHPDPNFHPVFCQFGVSRPQIKFNRLKGNGDINEVHMLLWTGCTTNNITLLALSKRFNKEIGSAASSNADKSKTFQEVTRLSRFGKAIKSDAEESQIYRVALVFDEQKVNPRKRKDNDNTKNEAGNDEINKMEKKKKPSWNGTLKADRRALEAIAHMESSNPEKAEKAKGKLRWWLIVTLNLQKMGPWYDYIDNSPYKKPFTRTDKSGENKETDNISKFGWPHADENKNREGHARLILSRLPGLRVLSVDLGHRYAAACAVWEALSSETFLKEVKGRKILRGGTDTNALYCHSKHSADGKRHVTIYRRIGADALPDGTPHPAPWARLDRQFLIKLQGEKEGVREASNAEIWAVHQLEAAFGRSVPLIDRLVAAGWGNTEKQKERLCGLKRLGWSPAQKSESGDGPDAGEEDNACRPSLSVDELMFSAVRTMRLALKRHGDRARIAHYLITDEKTKPGGMKEKLDEKGRIDLLLDALDLWHKLFSLSGWRDEAAKQLWADHIAGITKDKALEEMSKDDSDVERSKKQNRNQEILYHNEAQALARDEGLRKALHQAWKKRWEEDDERWRKQLRWLKDWILPRGKPAHDPSIRKVGGLSLTRLATLTEFRRKVQVGYFNRLHPDGTRAEMKEKFGQGTLDALEHLREQRVKQLASRIVEAALGIGSEDKRHWNEGSRPCRRINDPRFAPCHAVVIEDLTHYRPEETRTRRENRRLMTWSSSKVKKYLAEACELHGLHLREVPAGYTSRQDSRTGAPGIRCQDVPVKEFMRSPFWQKQVEQAKEKMAEVKDDSCARLLCDLDNIWKNKSTAEWSKAGVVRVPLKGGGIFVSADPGSPAAKGLQADLNAAANIGLRALTDPDWPGMWWYVPCDPTSFKPVKDKVKGSAAVKSDTALIHAAQTQSKDTDKAKKKRGETGAGTSKEVINLWRDISSSPLDDFEAGKWEIFAEYWNEVQNRVISILEEKTGNPRHAVP